MALEIEGKWLVNKFDLSLATKKYSINQGYVARDPNGTILRVRKSDNICTLTVKSKANKGSKIEIERPIEKDLFDELWALTEGRRVEKVRYIVPIYGTVLLGEVVELTAEVDVFGGRHSGIVTVEIEVPTIAYLNDLRNKPPKWFGLDVTENHQYSNSWLADNGMPDNHRPVMLGYQH
jgi:adenylate cyclase